MDLALSTVVQVIFLLRTTSLWRGSRIAAKGGILFEVVGRDHQGVLNTEGGLSLTYKMGEGEARAAHEAFTRIDLAEDEEQLGLFRRGEYVEGRAEEDALLQ